MDNAGSKYNTHRPESRKNILLCDQYVNQTRVGGVWRGQETILLLFSCITLSHDQSCCQQLFNMVSWCPTLSADLESESAP